MHGGVDLLAQDLLGAAALTAVVSLLPGCSDDSSSNKNSLTGSFVDSAVQGLRYQAEPSGLKGLTNADGNFRYRAGDTDDRLQRGIHLTINGIAATLRNSG